MVECFCVMWESLSAYLPPSFAYLPPSFAYLPPSFAYLPPSFAMAVDYAAKKQKR